MIQPLVSSLFKNWGLHWVSRNGEASQADRGLRAGQRYEDGFPRNLGGPCVRPILRGPEARGDINRAIPCGPLRRREQNVEKKDWSEEANP